MEDKPQNSGLNIYFGQNSALLSSIKLGAYYNVNNALDDLEAISKKIDNTSVLSVTEANSSIKATTGNIIDRLQFFFDKSASLILKEQLRVPEDLLVRSAQIFSDIKPKFESNKQVKIKLEHCANCVNDSINKLVKNRHESLDNHNALYDAQCKLYLSYSSLFRTEFEHLIANLLGDTAVGEKVGVEGIYKNIKKYNTNIFHALSRSSILFHMMLQILLNYCIATKLDAFFIHFSQCVVGALHLFLNDTVQTNSEMNHINVYFEPLQSVIILIQVMEDMSGLDEFLEENKNIKRSDRLIKEILNKLSMLLKTSRCTYVTKVLLTLCVPYKQLCTLMKFSENEKLEFHVLLKS